MKYYEMMYDYENDDSFLFAEPCVDVEDEYIVYDGKIIEGWDTIKFECDIDEGPVPTEKLGNAYGWEMFSEKALNLFEDIIKGDVQLLPVVIVDKDNGQDMGKYFVVNVLPLLDALDLEHSVYDYDDDQLSVVKYAIKEEKVEGHHIFRLRDSRFAVFVSEKFREIAKANKMLGVDFLEIKSS